MRFLLSKDLSKIINPRKVRKEKMTLKSLRGRPRKKVERES